MKLPHAIGKPVPQRPASQLVDGTAELAASERKFYGMNGMTILSNQNKTNTGLTFVSKRDQNFAKLTGPLMDFIL